MGYFVNESVEEYRKQKEREKDAHRERMTIVYNLIDQANRTKDPVERARLNALASTYRY